MFAGLRSTIDQAVFGTLMISLTVIVLDEFRDHVPKVSLSERNDLLEALALDGKDEPLGEGVQIRGSVAEAE